MDNDSSEIIIVTQKASETIELNSMTGLHPLNELTKHTLSHSTVTTRPLPHFAHLPVVLAVTRRIVLHLSD